LAVVGVNSCQILPLGDFFNVSASLFSCQAESPILVVGVTRPSENPIYAVGVTPGSPFVF